MKAQDNTQPAAETAARDYKDIRKDYVWDASIFNAEPERVAKLKYIICERLSAIDRTIILLYVDCLSYRKLGKRMHMSHMTCRKEVLRIKKIILEEYAKL